MSSLARLRAKICAAAFALGIAAAFLTYTTRGLLVLGISLAVAGVLALWLWRAKPELFLSQADGQGDARAHGGARHDVAGGRRPAGPHRVPPQWPVNRESTAARQRERVS